MTLKIIYQRFPTTRRCFSICCIGHQKMADFDDSWKWTSNYFKNHWNRETFGPKLDKKTVTKLKELPKTRNNSVTEDYWTSKMHSTVEKSKDLRETILEAAASLQPDETSLESLGNYEPDVSYNKKTLVQKNDERNMVAENYPIMNLAKCDDVTFDTIRYPRLSNGSLNVDTVNVSVTRVLKATMPVERRLALQRWEERLVQQMGREKFDEMQQLTLIRGERLHSAIQSYFQNGTFSPSTTSEIVADDDDDDVLRRHLLSLSTVMNRFSRPPLAIESEVVHTTLRYKGYVDCVTKYVNGGLVLVDWKTSKQPKSTLSATFDAPIQIAAYVGALNHDDRYPVVVKDAQVVIIYNDGSPADVLQINVDQLQSFWKLWLKRLSLYRSQKDFGNPQNCQTIEM